MTCQNNKDLNSKLALASLLVLVAVLTVVFGYVHGCGAQPASRVVQEGQPAPEPQPAPPPAPAPEPGPAPTKPACDSVVTFDKLQPLLSLNCAGCHAGYDGYDKAKSKFDEMDRRIKLDLGVPDHMPAQRPKLADKDIAVFDGWKAGGFLAANDCAGSSTGTGTPVDTYTSFKTAEQAMFADINSVTAGDQANTRYLVAQDQVNLGNADGVKLAKTAADKAINSVSTKNIIQVSEKVAPGIWRVNISDLGISAAQWTALEDASLLQFESFTQTGLALKGVTKSRLPWLPVQEFIDTALRNATIYYNLTKAPATVQQLEKNLGVDFSGDLASQKAVLTGFNGSSLSPAANRLVARFDSDAGVFEATFDTGPIVNANQNLFNAPLLVQAGGKANLQFAAGEQIYSLPNGLHAYFLADAKGNRLDQADPNVVHDFTSNPISPIIKNSISCYRCHYAGMIHATDQVRASLGGANLGAQDTQIALALYKQQTTVDALFKQDNDRYGAAAQQAGVNVQEPDPISRVSDKFLGDLTLEQVAALVWQRPEDLKTCINLSQVGKQQASQLLSGGTISHDQLVQVSKTLQADCRLFQDPLAQ